MGKKYIIEIEDDRNIIETFNGTFKGKCMLAVSARLGNTEAFINTNIPVVPYTEPDLEQVRKEGYEKGWKEAEDHYFDEYSNGYDAGLDDAWKAARKIWEYDATTLRGIFGEGITRMDWFMKLTAAEAIEKIWQYEQKKEEIKVGDEVAFHHDDGRPDTVVVVTYIGQDGFIDGMDGRGTQYAHKNPKKWTKTGRHFHEIATILEKMRGEQDGKRREE